MRTILPPTVRAACAAFPFVILAAGATPRAAWGQITHVALYTFHGDSARDEFGYSVSGAGDVDGDGRADLIVGAHQEFSSGSTNGSARVLSGATGLPIYTFNGDSAGDRFGWSVSGAGDVNGDGRADLIVGAFRDDNNGSDSGSARVLSGLTGLPLYTFNGDSAFDQFGLSVSGAGDVNGDGRADLIVGANRDNNTGSARVISGLTGLPIYTFNGAAADDFFGTSVGNAGDINNDGRPDLIVGATGTDNNGSGSGTARVFSGLTGLPLYTFNGDSEGDAFGRSVSGSGDVNNDGRPDVIVGASFDDNNGNSSGSARVLSGLTGLPLYTFNGDSVFDRFGESVSGAGDVNGDGFADLIVGAIDDDNTGNNSGSARVLSGATGLPLYTFNGDAEGDRFGWSVSGAGDVNGDGLADFIVGAPFGGPNDRGYARLFVSVPEPATAGVALLALAAPLLRRRTWAHSVVRR